jgi:hypothetical protein
MALRFQAARRSNHRGEDHSAVNSLRPLSDREKAVLAALLQSNPGTLRLIDLLDDLLVAEMNDGGMGSALLVPKGLEGVSRSFGQQLVLGEFRDTDGIPVSVALNVDSQGNLFELDVWKVNFSPLLAWPDPSHISILRVDEPTQKANE